MSHHDERVWNKASRKLGIPVDELKIITKTLSDLKLIVDESQSENQEIKVNISRSRLTQLACYDHLTGLPNEFLFKDRVAYLIAMSKREYKTFALMFIDLDNFKNVNDTYGHQVGDKILQLVSKILKNSTRANDMVARLHGDEFVIMLDGVTDNCEITEVISKKILRKIKGVRYSGSNLGISASIGISFYPGCGTTLSKLFCAADRAMYHVKRNGKNSVSKTLPQS